jgi:hypothetical protein
MLALAAASLLAACGTSQPQNPHGGHGQHGAEQRKEDHGGHGDQGHDKAEGIKTSAKWEATKFQAGADSKVAFQIVDDQGKPVENFDVGHEKLMHLIVVNKDLSYFVHLHPEYKGNGRFEATEKFPAGGEYKLFADYIPAGGSARTNSTWMTVEGTPGQQVPLQADKNLTKVVDGKEVTLKFDHLMSGHELELVFTIKDAATGQPLTDLEQYLGSVGHVVILDATANEYLHVHPKDEKAKGPDAAFLTTFPKKGLYKIWGQFQHRGQVFTVPFAVEVP